MPQHQQAGAGQAHTPGPWKASQTFPLGDYCIHAQGIPFQLAYLASHSKVDWPLEANARLIAAAPDYAAAAALAITALAFEQEKAQRAGDELAYAQITQAKNALIAADNKRLGREQAMKDVTPARAALSAAQGE